MNILTYFLIAYSIYWSFLSNSRSPLQWIMIYCLFLLYISIIIWLFKNLAFLLLRYSLIHRRRDFLVLLYYRSIIEKWVFKILSCSILWNIINWFIIIYRFRQYIATLSVEMIRALLDVAVLAYLLFLFWLFLLTLVILNDSLRRILQQTLLFRC